MKKCARFVWVVALLGSLAAQSGCMTLDHLMDPKEDISIYGGTAASLRKIEDPQTGWWGTFFRMLDFPLTMALDTVLIPVLTGPVQLFR